MTSAPLAPTLAVLVIAVIALWLPRQLAPQWATSITTLTVGLTTMAIAAGLLQLAAGGLASLTDLSLPGWCRAMYAMGHGSPPVLGLVAAVALAAMTVNVTRYVRRVRHEMAPYRDVDGVQIARLDGPVAFAVPGRRGGVVLGSALVQALDGAERAAVLAHEQAHLQHRHHRFVRTADACAAAIPLLRPAARRVRFLTERWADESAARTIGSRDALAKAIVRVALMPEEVSSAPAAALGIGGSGTLARVEALMAPRPATPVGTTVLAAAALALVATGSVVQVHHLAAFLTHICPG